MLNKLGGKWASKPSPGPHKQKECIPTSIVVRNRLRYALTGREAAMVVKTRNIQVDGVVRTDPTYPLGFQDVLSIPKTGEHFRLLYDVKGRFLLHRIKSEEASYKLGKVVRVGVGSKSIPYIVTHDGRTFRFPDPKIKKNDTVRIELKAKQAPPETTGKKSKGSKQQQREVQPRNLVKLGDFTTFDSGSICMATGGRNAGRIGVIVNREKHPGSHDIVHLRDSEGNEFATRLNYVFVIGKGNQPWISLPTNNGVKISTQEDREIRLKKTLRK